MQLSIVLDHRFERMTDGSVWTRSVYPYSFWSAYLAVFDTVKVIARVRNSGSTVIPGHRADGNGVVFHEVPFYLGPWEYLRRAGSVATAVRRAIGARDAVLFRVASTLANCAWPEMRKSQRPYGAEVVGDPYEAFSPGCCRHPMRPLFRRWFAAVQKRQCASAAVVSYVSARALQERYPGIAATFTTNYSDVILSDDAFVAAPRAPRPHRGEYQLITVGSLEQPYKGTDILIRAVADLVRAGIPIQLTVVGDGRYRHGMMALASRAGVTPRVKFAGQLPGPAAIREGLDAADLFVLPSRTEGLPRAMIEAMARALPCVGSAVGGIPELLPEADLFPAGDVGALSLKIAAVLNDCGRMASMSRHSLRVARSYHQRILGPRRHEFLQHLRDITAYWARRQGRCSDTSACAFYI
jgi:glycosyltransferase involved in cell wall biosynthesis